MEHINITFPEKLKKELDREAKSQRTARSTLIQKAVKVYLELKRRKALKDLLQEGYQEMSGTTDELMQDFKRLDRESWKHVD